MTTQRLGLSLTLSMLLSACQCSDPSTLGITSCADTSDCLGADVCCVGFCRGSCADDGGAGGGGGATGGGSGGGGGSLCVPACALGQICVNGSCECDATSCPSGCCSGAACTARSLSSCAAAGQACVGCDTGKADRCSSGGACQCGSGPACAAGQRCVNNACVCDSTSCASGCCGSDGGCSSPVSAVACGVSGAACSACEAAKANACSTSGACRCGNDPACGTGQRCGASGCVCDATSCPNGCCAGDTCTALTMSTCAAEGAACATCPAGVADGCAATGGGCSCGGNAACVTGQRCVAGACVCDATSCPTGCCAGGVCTTRALTTCGPQGQTCADCTGKGDSCSPTGSCRCGSGPACGPTQTCTNGQCTGGGCDFASCPDGCCDSSAVCRTRALASCGTAGSACSACDATRATACDASGSCVCGTSPACGPGQRCNGTACICDQTSCPTGCCAGNVCTATSGSQCGAAGATCAACPANSDTCSTGGSCVCGTTGGPCAAGKRCVSGQCVCDSTSCTSGCCNNSNDCVTLGASQCAPPGSTCGTCDLNRADTCSAGGQCRCGGSAQCTVGQRCANGTCVCDATSCPTGCCQSGNCTAPPTLQLCGTNGGSCTSCNSALADQCSGGSCACGSGPACGAGKRCVNQQCVCDSVSCANGCCEGGSTGLCRTPPSQNACGTGGATCFACPQNTFCGGSSCIAGNTGGGGAGGGGGTGGGAGGGGGGGGKTPVDHLELTEAKYTVDAGACVSFELDARDPVGDQVLHTGAPLSYELEPSFTFEVYVYPDSACTTRGATYVQGPAVQTGYLRAAKFGEAYVFPTVTDPPSGFSQGQGVQVTSFARVTGFPSTLVYNACTSIALAATAPALNDTDLSLMTSGSFTFSGSGCFGPTSPAAFYASSSTTSAYVRSNTGGMVQIVGSPQVLVHTPVSVTLVRPDAGTVCTGDGLACSDASECCSDTCLTTCIGGPIRAL